MAGYLLNISWGELWVVKREKESPISWKRASSEQISEMRPAPSFSSTPITGAFFIITGDDSIFGEVWMKAIENILKTFHEQQRKVTAKAYHFTHIE